MEQTKSEMRLDWERDRNLNHSQGMAQGGTVGTLEGIGNFESPVREQTAREVIECALKEVHEHIEGLNELLNALPAKLPWRADRALARLISAALRK